MKVKTHIWIALTSKNHEVPLILFISLTASLVLARRKWSSRIIFIFKLIYISNSDKLSLLYPSPPPQPPYPVAFLSATSKDVLNSACSRLFINLTLLLLKEYKINPVKTHPAVRNKMISLTWSNEACLSLQYQQHSTVFVTIQWKLETVSDMSNRAQKHSI